MVELRVQRNIVNFSKWLGDLSIRNIRRERMWYYLNDIGLE